MYDALGESTNKVVVKLKEIKSGKYEMELIPDKEWLENKDRKYPIVLDPTIDTSPLSKDIQDTFIASRDTQNKYLNDLLRVGNNSKIGMTRSYMKFTLPEIKDSDMVVGAYIDLIGAAFVDGNDKVVEGYSNNIGGQINIHRVKQDWEAKNINWNNEPQYDSKIEDFAKPTSDEYLRFNITAMVKEWYNKGNNYGVMLKNANEYQGDTKLFSSNYTCTTHNENNINDRCLNVRPKISISYLSKNGLEDYWTYHGEDVGRAGTAYANDSNGNLVFVHEDGDINGNRMPISLKHIYNSADRKTNIGYGNGWRINYIQRVYPIVLKDEKWFVYTDGDGTQHYFYYDKDYYVYKDTSGLDYKLNINADDSYKIVDKKDNKLHFSKAGYLYKIEDSNGNTLDIQIMPNETILTDGVGRKIKLKMENGLLKEIMDTAGRITKYEYNGNDLVKIVYSDSKVSTYDYDSGLMWRATNHDGLKVAFQYTNGLVKRVSNIKEIGSNNKPRNELDVFYDYNETTFKDIKGRENTYQFNNYGNTISIKDSFGNGESYKYVNNPSTKTHNKMELESKLQKMSQNYVKNHNIESNNNWEMHKWENSIGSYSVTTEDKFLGKSSLKVTKTNDTGRQFAYQILTLQPGKTYTVSGYVKASGITPTKDNGGAGIFVYTIDTDNKVNITEGKYVQNTDGWQRQVVTFTIPANVKPGMSVLATGLVDAKGTAYFDCVQVEEGKIANRYNLIENYDFSNFTAGKLDAWGTSDDCSSSSDLAENFEGRSTFRFIGEYNKKKNLYQTLYVSGNVNDSFVVGGWAKGQSIPLKDDGERRFSLYAVIENTDGTYQWEDIPFNQSVSQWQYVSSRIVAKKPYKSIKIYALYYNNENVARFDNIQVFKEEFGASYQYDKNNNVVSTENLAKQKSTFEYNGSNDLVKTTDPKGSEFKYEYDSKHNIKKATAATNVTYNFEYDNFGNPIKLTTAAADNSIMLTSSSEYYKYDNYMRRIKDSSGNTVVYDWNTRNGILDKTVDAKGNAKFNKYDANDNLIEVSTENNGDGIEVFSLSENVQGDKGTKPISDTVSYKKDIDGKSYLSGDAKTDLAYNLGTNISEGAMGIWVKLQKDSQAKTRYIIFANDKEANTNSVCIDSNNKVNVSLRDRKGNWINVLTSSNTLVQDKWYYVAYNWNLKDSSINMNLYLKAQDEKTFDKKTTSVSDFRNFSGDVVNIGSCPGVGSSDVLLKDYIYTPKAITEQNLLDISSGTYKFNKGVMVKNNYSYENDRIKTIGHNNFNYSFNYDSFGETTSVNVGNATLITNEYEFRSDNLKKSTYGNGQVITNEYDEQDRIKAKLYNNEESVRYHYDNNGNLGYLEDKVNKVDYRYIYDNANRLVGVKDTNNNEVLYNYDNNNNKQKIKEIINSNGKLTNYETSYGYDKDNRLTSIDNGKGKISLSYDAIGRLKSKTLGTINPFDITIGYEKGINGVDTTRVSNITNKGSKIDYTYDRNGNIETITEGNKKVKYYYDNLNQVTREDNEVLNKTIVYTYDNGGNTLTKVEYPYTTGIVGTVSKTINYGYGDANWKDKLTSYDGKPITYDEIGSPLTYDGYNYTWERGRTLTGITGNNKTIAYKYNDSGIRTEKNVNGVISKYTLQGDKVAYEEVTNGSNVDKIYYSYDAQSNLISINLNNVEYYYVRNIQGDIIGLIDASGNQVVSYIYDSWGKLISIDGSLKDSVGTKNPYRYRGYRYDTETGLYYLQSRYYNPEFGRFINADGIVGAKGDLLGHNLFAYCGNNPIMRSDPTGFLWNRAIVCDADGTEYPELTPKYISSRSNPVHKVMDPIAKATGSQLGGAIASSLDSTIAYAVTKQFDKWLFKPAKFNRALDCGLGGIYAASKFTKVAGALGIVATGIGVWDNFANYEHGVARSFVDVAVLGLGIGVGIGMATIGAPVLLAGAVGLGAGGVFAWGGGKIKDTFFSRRKY